MSSIETARAATGTGSEELKDLLDFLVTQEALGVTFLSAAIEGGEGTPSEPFLPVLRSAVTQEYHHVQALRDAGGSAITRSYWFPDAALDNGGVGVFSSLEMVETIEISLYLLGVNAYVRAGEDFGARLCAEALGTEAVHRALMRYAQNELGRDVGVPNDVGFENFDWQSLDSVRDALEGLGIGYGVETDQPGRFYEYPGDPIASGIGTPVSHTTPQ